VLKHSISSTAASAQGDKIVSHEKMRCSMVGGLVTRYCFAWFISETEPRFRFFVWLISKSAPPPGYFRGPSVFSA
jgi:hypothetical protein